MTTKVDVRPVLLGDTVEIADPRGSWQGRICVVDSLTARANVTALDGQGAASVRLDSPDLRVLTSDPQVQSCPDCQRVEFGMTMLCEQHA